MNQMRSESPIASHERASPKGEGESFVLGFHGVRYQVKDVSRSFNWTIPMATLSSCSNRPANPDAQPRNVK